MKAIGLGIVSAACFTLGEFTPHLKMQWPLSLIGLIILIVLFGQPRD
jgi:hypothetical protein